MGSLRLQILWFALLLSSCTPSFVDLGGGYHLSAIDVPEDMSLGCNDMGNSIGVVDNTVFAAGFDDHFIIIKQHPRQFPQKPDKSVTNYYIILKENPNNLPCYENKIGSLNEEQFIQRRIDYGIPENLEFTIVFSSLE